MARATSSAAKCCSASRQGRSFLKGISNPFYLRPVSFWRWICVTRNRQLWQASVGVRSMLWAVQCFKRVRKYPYLVWRQTDSHVSLRDFYCCDGVRLCLCGTGPLTGPLSIPQMIHGWTWSNGGMILTEENQGTRRKTSPRATSSTKNPKWTYLGANPGLRGKETATKHGTAFQRTLWRGHFLCSYIGINTQLV
jgi:hypothetical protein